MAKKATLTTVSSGHNSASAINADLGAINDKLDNTLSLDGSTPNSMGADLDMNSNNITNAADIAGDTLTLGGVTFVPNNAATIPDWEGAWVTATAYAVNDLVQESGNAYICLEAHTSGTFSTDLSANKWELFASKGAAGAGTGDLLAANNLSDLNNADTALANLGGGTTGIALFKDTTAAAARTELGVVPGTDVQAYDAVLADLAGLSLVQGDLLYYDGANLQRLAKGTASQQLRMNSGATAPEWVTPSSSGWTLLTDTTISTDATVDFTSLSAYRTYAIVVEGVVPATDGVTLRLRTSTSATFNSGATDYEFAGEYGYGGNLAVAMVYYDDPDTTSIQLSQAVGSAAGEHVSGVIYVHNMHNASLRTTFHWNLVGLDSGGNHTYVNAGGGYRSAENNDGLRLYFSSGNLSTGNIVLYGLTDV